MAGKYSLTWDLDSLLPHPETEEFDQTLRNFRTDLKALAERSETLPAVNGESNHTEAWVTFLDEYADVAARASDLNAFIGCHAAADAENKLFHQMEAQLAALSPLQSQIATNIDFALKAACDAEFESFVNGNAGLKELEFYLQESREYAAMRLPKEQELLAADLAVDGIHAWGRLYDRLSGELRVTIMEKGKLVEKSPSQVQFDSPERTVRENNFYASNKAWAGIADTCADALNHLAGTRLTIYRRLGVTDHLDVPLRYNRIQRETLDAMWSTVSARKGMLGKYFDAKAKLLGLEKLSWYDLTAPLPEASQVPELKYDDACDRVISTFSSFSPDFGDFAKMALDDKWVEVENRPGKRQGGFCTGIPTKKQSRIFMTFTNSPDSMSTLAHELGHAYHSWVLKDRPLFLSDYPMGLAETASTFAEAVLGDQQLRSASTPAEQRRLLDIMLGDSATFLMNIHTRFIFEDNFHKERGHGELTADRFCELMQAAQEEAYQGQLADDGWNKWFWVSKLHFYISGYPFYNFPYTFGYLLSLGVYALADEVGESFPQQYRDLLIATGCKNAEDAVQSTFGYDLTKPDFWNKSLDIIEQRVARFLELV